MTDDKKLIQYGSTPTSAETNGSSALASVPRSIFDMRQEHFDRLKLMAQMYAASAFNSGNGKLTEGDAFIIMMKGIEVGLAPMAAMDFINVIHGKPVIDGKGMLALVLSSGKAEYVNIDSQPEQCMITTKRTDGGGEQVVVWDMKRAQMMGLTSKQQWKSQPQTMLKWRAVAEVARQVYPDVIGGLYTKEELGDNVVVQDNGEMQQIPASTSNPKSKPKPTQDRRLQTGASSPQGDEGDTHWAADMEQRKQFFDYAIRLGLGETVTEAWAYISENYADQPITKASELNANMSVAQARIKQLADALGAEVGATDGKYWTAERHAQLIELLGQTFDKTSNVFEAALDVDVLPEYKDVSAAMKACADLAVEKGWTMHSDYIEYTKHGNAKVMIFHLPKVGDYRHVMTDENGRPIPLVAYGGRTNLKSELGTDTYDALGISDWSEGNTYEIEDGVFKFKAQPNFNKDGTLYYTVTDVCYEGHLPTPKNEAPPTDNSSTQDIPF